MEKEDQNIIPNFFIVGAPKSGTTNMSYYLNQHPRVYMPDDLEPYYFARLDTPKNFKRYIIKDKKKYLDLFKKGKNHKAVGESSPVYLFCPHSPLEIKNHFPGSKIIISLRNPIEVVHSMYHSLVFMLLDKESFIDKINLDEKNLNGEFDFENLLTPCFYSKHIQKFQEIFPAENIKIIIFEEYIKNTEKTIESILKFLGITESLKFTDVPKGAYRMPRNSIMKFLLQSSRFRKTAQSLIPTVTRQKFGEKFFVKEGKKPKMQSNEREKLRKIFESDVEKLETMLGRKITMWQDFYE